MQICIFIKHETTFFKQYEIDNDENYPSSNYILHSTLVTLP